MVTAHDTSLTDDSAYPRPDFSDLWTMKTRLDRTRQTWVNLVQSVRENRYHLDQTPAKWQERLNIPSERRFRTNMTDNEINRVTALLSRNRPKVNIPAAGESDKAKERAFKQSRWSGQLFDTFERGSLLPLYDRTDDAAVEAGIGVFEEFLTPEWDRYLDLVEQHDTASTAKERHSIEAELASIGFPAKLRVVDPLALYFEPDDHDRIFRGMIVERKDYRQVYASLKDTLSADEFAAAQLPAIAALSTPVPSAWRVLASAQGEPAAYDATPDENGTVECWRYYDRRWLVEVVAGKVVRCEEHGLPWVPLFIQFGRVTSSSYMGYMLRGVTFGTWEQELAANDIGTLMIDNWYTYGRPFPVVETDVEGAPLLDQSGQPATINLSDPTQPPQLGPGQHVKDAFGGMRGQLDPQFVNFFASVFRQSGINPIATGESTGADPSGYAINTLTSGALNQYVTHLKNKERMLEQLVDFNRLLVRDVIQGPVVLAVKGDDGSTIDYVKLEPKDVDEVPCEVIIDPLSDAQRMAIAEWAITGNEKGFLSHRTTQRVAYGSAIDNFEAEDDDIVEDSAKQALVPIIIQSVVSQIQQDAFPETMGNETPATGGGPLPPTAPGGGEPFAPGAPQGPPSPSSVGMAGTASRRANGAGGFSNPAAALSARGRGGQQPTSQPLTAVPR